MSKLIIKGGFPLEGDVEVSGSRNSALKIIAASVFCNGEVTLNNIPRIGPVEVFGKIIEALGGSFSYLTENKVLINTSGINSYQVPYEIAKNSRQANLFVGPLLYRFGKAVIPTFSVEGSKNPPINRWIYAWEELGYKVNIGDHSLTVEGKEPKCAKINFRTSTHTGTDNAILSSIFVPGETIINNAAEEDETEDLINFLNSIGADIVREENRRIRIIGKNVFSGFYYSILPDNTEVAAFSSASVHTRGNVRIRGISELNLLSFINFLNKANVRYEYSKEALNVWYSGEVLQSCTVSTGPSPDFLADWVPYASLILAHAKSTSYIHDKVYVDRLGFANDLKKYNCKMRTLHPSEIGEVPVISDDSYDYEAYGEPKTILEILAPTEFASTQISLSDPRFDPLLIITALGISGETIISDYDEKNLLFEDFVKKLKLLGAHIEIDD